MLGAGAGAAMASERSREGDGILPVRAEATVVDESIREQKGFALPTRHVDLVNGFGARGTQPSIHLCFTPQKKNVLPHAFPRCHVLIHAGRQLSVETNL